MGQLMRFAGDPRRPIRLTQPAINYRFDYDYFYINIFQGKIPVFKK